MKQINGHGLSGPYKSEQEFKTAWIKCTLERSVPYTKFFCIETEETEPGFPDVMKLDMHQHASFYEMKIADGKDFFILQHTQPLFYRNHSDMEIVVLVWSNKRNKLFAISTAEIITRVLGNTRLTLCLDDFKEE